MNLKGYPILPIVLWLLWSCDKQGKNGSVVSDSSNGRENPKIHQNSIEGVPAPESIRLSQAKGKILIESTLRWTELSNSSSSEVILERQRSLAIETVLRLGPGVEVIEFLDFLSGKGAGDLRQSLIESGLCGIFKGPDAENARDWLLTLEDKKLREKLSRKAGEQFQGIGFKNFFSEMGRIDHNCQSALLTGYCVSLAKSDPEGAVRLYKELGYPQKIDNTGLADVMASFPPNTNFLKFATETKEDSMTLAKKSRSALLQNWAGVSPEEAAQYVLANSATSVNPDQMGVVIGTWAKQSPDAAVDWLNKAPVGKARDEGMAALARQSTASAPAKALEYAGQISDFDKRVTTATQVFKEWEKIDRPAATAAWLKLFPDPAQK